MDDFLGGMLSFSEDSNGEDHGEAEAALYSMVHHSGETYNSSMLEFSGDYINQRNRVNRWDVLKQLGESIKPDNFVFHPQEINQTLNHIPIVDNNISGISKTMFDQQFCKRGQNVNYRRNEKPQYINDRIKNIYQRKSNLVPVFVQRNEFSQRYTADPQAILKINNFSSFETPGNDIGKKNLSNQFNRENFENHDRTSVGSIVNNVLSELEQTRNMLNRTNACHGLKVTGDHGASTSKEQSTSSITEVFSDDTPKRSTFLLNKNSNISVDKNNTSDIVEVSSAVTEEVIISDTDCNEDHSDQSIVEVSPAPKPSPPLIVLEDSSDESEMVVSKESLILNVSDTNDKLAPGSPNSRQSTPTSSKNVNNPLFTISSTSKERKKKKKKKHKLVNSFECKSWTTGMMKFYNKSWGGEAYDHLKLLREMTPNPKSWKILDIDKYGPVRNYGPRIRCANCHQLGHIAQQCPDPRKVKCCAMCGKRGHLENQCPNKLCLKCGRPAPLFNEGCPSCWNHPQKCASCGGVDHFKWLCPDVWRKLHSVTTTEALEAGVLEETMYKSSMELNCCFCAGQGHLAASCPRSSKQTFSMPESPSIDIFSTWKILNKKRKNKRSFYLEEKYNQQEFNRKRRKTK